MFTDVNNQSGRQDDRIDESQDSSTRNWNTVDLLKENPQIKIDSNNSSLPELAIDNGQISQVSDNATNSTNEGPHTVSPQDNQVPQDYSAPPQDNPGASTPTSHHDGPIQPSKPSWFSHDNVPADGPWANVPPTSNGFATESIPKTQYNVWQDFGNSNANVRIETPDNSSRGAKVEQIIVDTANPTDKGNYPIAEASISDKDGNEIGYISKDPTTGKTVYVDRITNKPVELQSAEYDPNTNKMILQSADGKERIELNPDGSKVTYDNASGHPTEMIDANGNQFTYKWDSDGKPSSVMMTGPATKGDKVEFKRKSPDSDYYTIEVNGEPKPVKLGLSPGVGIGPVSGDIDIPIDDISRIDVGEDGTLTVTEGFIPDNPLFHNYHNLDLNYVQYGTDGTTRVGEIHVKIPVWPVWPPKPYIDSTKHTNYDQNGNVVA